MAYGIECPDEHFKYEVIISARDMVHETKTLNTESTPRDSPRTPSDPGVRRPTPEDVSRGSPFETEDPGKEGEDP